LLLVFAVSLLGGVLNIVSAFLDEASLPYVQRLSPQGKFLVTTVLIVLIPAATVVLYRLEHGDEQKGPLGSGPLGPRHRLVLLQRAKDDVEQAIEALAPDPEQRVELDLEWRPDLAGNRGARERDPPPGRLIDVIREHDDWLALLGAPGAGKSTRLLELARDLADTADRQPDAPVPVIFSLSRWNTGSKRTPRQGTRLRLLSRPPWLGKLARRRPKRHRESSGERSEFANWLSSELAERYPLRRAEWHGAIDQDQIIPLLDGLDELAPASRAA